MKQIDQILIRHGIAPTVVDLTDKKRLCGWLAELEHDTPSSFWAFGETVEAIAKNSNVSLHALAERISGLVDRATRTIEPLLDGYPERAVTLRSDVAPATLTRQHAKILTEAEEIERETNQLTEQISSATSVEDTSILIEISLRRVALEEFGKYGDLLCRYRDLAEKTAAYFERTKQVQRQLINHAIQFRTALSNFALSASAALTESNRKSAPQTNYFKIVQQTLLVMHTISQAIKQIQSEATYV